jgi:hypothetical protein
MDLWLWLWVVGEVESRRRSGRYRHRRRVPPPVPPLQVQQRAVLQQERLDVQRRVPRWHATHDGFSSAMVVDQK